MHVWHEAVTSTTEAVRSTTVQSKLLTRWTRLKSSKGYSPGKYSLARCACKLVTCDDDTMHRFCLLCLLGAFDRNPCTEQDKNLVVAYHLSSLDTVQQAVLTQLVPPMVLYWTALT